MADLRADIPALPLPPAREALRRCAACGAAEVHVAGCKLRACPCHLVRYCCSGFQLVHWPQHQAAHRDAMRVRKAGGAGGGSAAAP